MNKHYITSSIGAYFLIGGAFIALSSGFVKLFWIYLFLAIIFGIITAYQIYLSSKKQSEKVITYYFFATDKLTAGLLLASFYFNLIDISNKGAKRLLLFIGIFLIFQHFMGLRKQK